MNVLPFDAIALPDLLVIVGLNGSGKSNLLRSIAEEHTQIFLEGDQKIERFQIKLIEDKKFSVQNITAKMQPSFSVGQREGVKINTGRGSIYIDEPRFESIRRNMLKTFEEELIQLIPAYKSISDGNIRFGTQSPDDIGLRLNINIDNKTKDDVLNIYKRARKHIIDEKTPLHVMNSNVSASLIQNQYETENFQIALLIVRAAELASQDILSVNYYDLSEIYAWGSIELFDPKIAELFSIYKNQANKNAAAQLASRQGDKVVVYNDEQFEKVYGLPPWDQITDVIASLGLPYKVMKPNWQPEFPVEFALQRISDGTIIDFEALSSGEKVLLRFALSIFRYDPLRVALLKPKVLLLDEMDASLHPEMVSRWLNAIRSHIVGALGIKCILTTHSPTTVALSSDESLYEMAEGVNGPQKVSRQKAINRLTHGLPALTVDFESRRQVFTESNTDAKNYERLITILKNKITLPRTLTFMSTGPSNEKHETNTGCSAVEHIVKELTATGNKSVFGILDWDLKRSPADRIKIISHGSHYAIDNLILNPLLIGALLIRHFGEKFPGNVGISDFPAMNQHKAQILTDVIQNKLVYPRSAPAGFTAVRFFGGFEVQVKSSFALTNGHDMEAELADKFKKLGKFTNSGRGRLIEAVIDFVLEDWPNLIPLDIASIFTEISEQEI
ncbi:AAA family ATPase [uncultured Methylobacterium sp.]|uniref:AAA family ATPase n=1 Tax=uncultured Methylobacterium sp. TaxID=157278 RepID=UPI00261E0F0F|nr:AAA family ATPase [uncultured Methylobacterium sp.]